MKIVEDFPRRVRSIETAWIPMSDGARLAARIWLPEDAENGPVPAILEYIPYRRRDGHARGRDALSGGQARRMGVARALALQPSLTSRPPGCEFYPRCKYVQARCRSEAPDARPLSDGRLVRCHFPLVA